MKNYFNMLNNTKSWTIMGFSRLPSSKSMFYANSLDSDGLELSVPVFDHLNSDGFFKVKFF